MILEVAATQKLAYLQHCEHARGLSVNTLDAYAQDIDGFIDFLDKSSRLNSHDGALVLAYLEYLKRERKYKPATIRRRLVTLRAYAGWLCKSGHIDSDPFIGLNLDLKPPKRLPRPVEWVDIQTMLKADAGTTCDTASMPPAFSDKIYAASTTTTLAIKLLVSTGVRVGELTHITLSNVSNDGYRIRIHGKGNKERNVYIGNPDLRAELRHVKWQASQTPHDGDYLLLNHNRKRLTEQALRRRLRILGQSCSLDTRVTPHRFRHSAATFLIEEGVDIRFVQRLLGHSSIATTEIYTRVSDTALMQAINSADPLGKLLSKFT